MTTRVPKNWGYEDIIYNGEYCCKALVYTHRVRSSLHYHEKKHETFVVVSGLFEIEVGDYEMGMSSDGAIVAAPRKQEPQRMGPGTYIVLPPRTHHRIRCIEPGTIIEASTHDDPDDCVRLAPSDSVQL